jgi:hypothetical protein
LISFRRQSQTIKVAEKRKEVLQIKSPLCRMTLRRSERADFSSAILGVK